ncbi:type II toxin-antitoxin system VapC family toxin [Nostocaceae cyanobacterium CENA357]|uniref:Type II toxin-antitoxin system VapC family toxin n=1 Tax=Atlanticothrix silvestris CENA357 TaxID=1725252 RepID=A0A8J7HI32_9CYAN|nr:type II toxin-antitoxin system VapC family toxin [Atlanticothrix silvestris]MBH8555464.1 type II toxin-antitoxin system VapC family toxin [Atlanticothrix silvestris CENA357]
MYILDTDHLSFIQRNSEEGKRVLTKLATVEELEVAVTVITYEEQIRGRLNVLSRAKMLDEQVFAYQGLQQLALDYQSIRIIPFSRIAALEHQRLRKAYSRLGNMDLKIAAISLTNNTILLTRNESDFGKIVELRTEDWSIV